MSVLTYYDGLAQYKILTAAQIASPTQAQLRNITTTYVLNVPPYTRYRSDGAALVSADSIGGSLLLEDGDELLLES
jgi:hypothetical protein